MLPPAGMYEVKYLIEVTLPGGLHCPAQFSIIIAVRAYVFSLRTRFVRECGFVGGTSRAGMRRRVIFSASVLRARVRTTAGLFFSPMQCQSDDGVRLHSSVLRAFGVRRRAYL